MRRPRGIQLLVVFAAASLLLVSCPRKEPAPVTPEPTAVTEPVTSQEPVQDVVAIGVSLSPGQEKPDVRPEFAYVTRGQAVEWFSTNGQIDIEFKNPPAKIQKPGCDVPAPCGGKCSLSIPKDQATGRYPYILTLTIDGKEYVRNQPEVIVK